MRKKLFTKDPWCWWCRKLLTLHPKNHAEVATIEHLKPLRDGGTDDEYNLALTHSVCNK